MLTFLYLLTGILYIPSFLFSMFMLAMAGDPVQTKLQGLIHIIIVILNYIIIISIWTYLVFFDTYLAFDTKLCFIIIWALINPIITFILGFLWLGIIFPFLNKKVN